MQELVHSFTNLSLNDPAVWMAIGTFLLIVLIFVYRTRRSGMAANFASGSSAESTTLPPTNWQSALRRTEEKRRSVRRGGVPTPIVVLDPNQSRKPLDAYVLDRSTGGIRIALQKPVQIGSTVHVRPHNSTEDVPWIPVLIRNCREVGDYFEIGCQFEKELPWNLLLLFG